jgi:hypothetical protein
MKRIWEMEPAIWGGMTGFFVLPTLWVLQIIVLRLIGAVTWPLGETYGFCFGLGTVPGAMLGSVIAPALNLYRAGDAKKARFCLVYYGGLITLILLWFLHLLSPLFYANSYPRLSGILHIPPALLPFIDPRTGWNFPFHCALLTLFIGLLRRTRR